ncbi:ROK family transcriptional regulator [Paroceanicella profunda]|nr:ROK family transcriptional regulator [Paroceanicella profunda]
MPGETIQTAKDRLRSAVGNNPGRSRSHNRRVVLDLLRSHGQLGRKQLADMTRLTTQAVANIIEELLAENLLIDLGRRRSGRGQPPIQFALNPDGAITIGIEISVTDLATAVLDLGGNLRHARRIPVADARPAALLPLIEAQVDALRASFPAALMGVGVVMPGPFEIEGLSGVGPTTLPGWAGTDIAARLAERLGVPVRVENDANAAAVGETLFGAGQALSDFCLIYFGAGIGLGIISSNQPLRGAFGNAGEIGHVVVSPGGRPCQCGQSGCLERYASLHALREHLAAADRPADFAALEEMQRRGDPLLAEWVEMAAAHLSIMVGLLENILDPETVILGGALPDSLIEALIARLRPGPSVSNRSDRHLPRVTRGQTGQMTAALGAAALPFFDALMPRLDLSEKPARGEEQQAGLARPA